MAGKKEGNGFITVKETLTEKLGGMKKSWRSLVNRLLFNDDTYGSVTHKFPNIAFYSNEIPANPLKDKIEDILETWKGDYNLLQTNYLYTQWLFPNRKPGINGLASVLKDKDVEVISSTPLLQERLRRAFQMMLDFYGMKLTEDNQFELSENPEERLEELNQGQYNHNYLRITRILLALKELGLKQLMLPWLKFIANLVYREKVLNSAASSFEKFWINTLDAEESILLNEYLEQLKLMKPTETKDGSLLDTLNTKDESKADSCLPTNNSTTINGIGTSLNTNLTTPNTAPETEPDVIPSSTKLTSPDIVHDSKADIILDNTYSNAPPITQNIDDTKTDAILPSTDSTTPLITYDTKVEEMLPTN